MTTNTIPSRAAAGSAAARENTADNGVSMVIPTPGPHAPGLMWGQCYEEARREPNIPGVKIRSPCCRLRPSISDLHPPTTNQQGKWFAAPDGLYNYGTGGMTIRGLAEAFMGVPF